MESMTVFISSTHQDLAAHRRAVLEELLRLRQTPLSMEYLGSEAEDATTVSVSLVQDCDVFVGIYAERYGHTPDPRGKSITEQEYDTARKLGKRCLCYFAGPDSTPPGHEDSTKRARLTEFKRRIDAELVRSIFTSPDNLAARVGADLARVLAGEPLGFVSTDVQRRWRHWQTDVLARLQHDLLDDRAHVVEPSPREPWRSFIGATAWHLQRARELARIRANAAEIPELSEAIARLDTVDCLTNYVRLLEELRERVSGEFLASISSVVDRLTETKGQSGGHGQDPPTLLDRQLAQARKVDEDISRLKYAIEMPKFGRCFLIVGGHGAGKTHFLASLLREDVDVAHPCLLLPLTVPSSRESLENLLLAGGRRASGIHWRTLEELNGFFAREGGSEYKDHQSSLDQGGHIRREAHSDPPRDCG